MIRACVIPIPTEHTRAYLRKKRRKARAKTQEQKLVAWLNELRSAHNKPDWAFIDFINAGIVKPTTG